MSDPSPSGTLATGKTGNFSNVLEDMIDSYVDIYKKIVEAKQFGEVFRLIMFRRIAEALSRTA